MCVLQHLDEAVAVGVSVDGSPSWAVGWLVGWSVNYANEALFSGFTRPSVSIINSNDLLHV